MPAGLVLASASPRRRELLALLGVDFRVAPAAVDETSRRDEAPAALAVRLAEAKARAIDAEVPVLGADTIVVVGAEILGKPRDVNEADRMLATLADREHRVITALALRHGDSLEALTVTTRVWFRALAGRERRTYAAHPEALDAAGAYAIQGGAAAFVTRLVGSYSNVVGLPLAQTARLLAAVGSGA